MMEVDQPISYHNQANEPDKAIIENSKKILEKSLDSLDEDDIKEREMAILDLAKVYSEKKMAKELAELNVSVRPFLIHLSKAKSAKIVRTLVDLFLDLEAGTGQEIKLCKDCINWANKEKRFFLRQTLETRYMSLLYENKRYEEALAQGSSLLLELKKLDDKVLLVEVQLLESKVYYMLSNFQKAKAALTTARTTANAIYCPPRLQAFIDLVSGILHCAEDKEYKTAFSYFYEALEGFDSINSNKTISALKYMILMKIMMNEADDLKTILGTKVAMKYTHPHITMMKELADAAKERSLSKFLNLTQKYKKDIDEDIVIKKHLNTYYNTILGHNLLKLIEPYSKVQIAYISKLINLPLDEVEKNLSQMILDKELNGVLDQGLGVLVLVEELSQDKDYEHSENIIQNLGGVLDCLFEKSKKLA